MWRVLYLLLLRAITHHVKVHEEPAVRIKSAVYGSSHCGFKNAMRHQNVTGYAVRMCSALSSFRSEVGNCVPKGMCRVILAQTDHEVLLCRWEFELITPLERLVPSNRDETLERVRQPRALMTAPFQQSATP